MLRKSTLGLFSNLRIESFRSFAVVSSPAGDPLGSKTEIIKKDNEKVVRFLKSDAETLKHKAEEFRKAHNLYYGPARDMKNFPPHRINECPPKTRFGILPSSWFENLYSKIGVSGTYTLPIFSVLFLMNKEFIVYNEQFIIFMGYLPLYWIFSRLLPHFTKDKWYTFYDKSLDAITVNTYKKIYSEIDYGKKFLENRRIEGKALLDLAKIPKENVAVQLELDYRNRCKQVYYATKRKLDYQMIRANTIKKFQRDYLINSIIDDVIKEYDAKKDKMVITQCLGDLKTLAQTAKA